MRLTRRQALVAGGGVLTGLVIRPVSLLSSEIIDIEMRGTANGSSVWFDPIGLHLQPGQTVRWTNRDPGNSHTATAYHPSIRNRPRRLPPAAEPWDSDYLLPDESYTVTLSVPGVYDYYCVPHEHAGMVGRIVVGEPGEEAPMVIDPALEPLPEIALGNFPPVAEILARGVVRHR